MSRTPNQRSSFCANVAKWLAALLFTAVCGTASGQRLLVRTETLTTSGEPVRVSVHSVDMRRKEALPGGETLPGPESIGPILLSADGHLAISSTATNRTGGDFDARNEQTFLSGLRVAPFASDPGAPMVSVPGWREYAACLTADPANGNKLLVVLGGKVDDFGLARGRLELLDCGSGPKIVWPRMRATYALPGPPVGGVHLEGSNTVAVLCRGPYGEGAILHVHDLATSKARVDALTIETEGAIEARTDPSGLAVSRDGNYLLVVTSGHASSRPDGETVSWLHVYDTENYSPVGSVLEFAGTLDKAEPGIYPTADGACWLATRSPGTGFAHVLKALVQGNEVRLSTVAPLTGVTRALRLAPSPDGAGVAVGVDNRLEIWPKGQPPGVTHSFGGAVGAIVWSSEGLFVGEAGRVHQIDTATGAPSATVQLQTGHVQAVVLVPAATLPQPDSDADGLTDAEEQKLGTSPDSPDSDGDGIPDGSDAEPMKASPRLTVPAWITLNGSAAGHELRDVLIAPKHGEQSSWQVYWERQAMPWLVVSPTSGQTGTPFYLGVNPARYGSPTEVLEGKLRVYLTGTDTRKPASGSPATVGIWVRPRGATLRRILWIGESPEWVGRLRDSQGPWKLDTLAGLLAGPPMSYSHHEVSSAYVEPFRSHSIVVLTAAAAARGAVTRQAVLDDYVARGGALLFLGGYLEGTSPDTLARWLAPAGIQIDTGTQVAGSFETRSTSNFCRRLPRMDIRGGCALRVDDQSMALAPTVPNAEKTAFATALYGAGRIAVLASPTPLQDAALQSETNVQFALELFQWLGQAGKGLEDTDGDGIPDSLEDRNGNGRVDSGETDRLNPDTDGDGISDGDEDLNRNGRLDEGETSPLNPDSNGNGIWDGADEQPLPPAGSAAILRVEPPEGPGEGGYSLLVTGRNFPPGATLIFGGRASPSVRRLSGTALVAVAPACPPPEGSVDIVLGDAEQRAQGVLPKGFRYLARSTAEISLKDLGGGTADSGRIGVWVTVPSGVPVGRVSVSLVTVPTGVVEWSAPTVGATAESSGRAAISRPSPDGLFVDVSAGDSGSGGGLLAVVPWKRNTGHDASQGAQVSVRKARVMTPNGESLQCTIDETELTIGEDTP